MKTPGRRGQLEQLLDRVLELAPGERPAFLDRACSGDPALRAEVERLLRAAEGASEFLRDPAPVYAAPLLARLASAPALSPGHRLGVYEIERELGRGGMAMVYLAHDRKHHRLLAIKVLHSELAQAVGPERFLREIEVIARLQHPHILPLLDSGETEGRLYYVMPYVEGESLRQRLTREKQLPVEAALRIAREAAEALDYAHRHGIVHRDIKPENILLADGQAVVADFGIARAIHAAGGESLTETGIILGTAAYMSPEQAAGTEQVDGRTDVYSLGCVAYEMLAGQAPFTGPTAESVIRQHLAAEPPAVTTLRPGAPPELGRAIARAMAKTPADRFETAGQFAEALARATTERAGAPTLPHQPARSADERAKRVRMRTAVLGLIVLAALLGIAFLRLRSKPLHLDPTLVAVAPFDVLEPELGLWREGLVDYLSRNLDGAGSLRTVSPTVVMRRWRGRADAVSGHELGQVTGAKLVLVGQLVGAGSQSVRLRATLIDAASGRRLAEFERADQSERVDRLADSLTLDLLRELGRTASETQLRLTSVGTKSLPALKAFLQGEQWYRQTVWDSALFNYERAVALDTTFAIALHHLAWTHFWLSEYGIGFSLYLRAARFNHGLAPRDSLLLTADSLEAAFADTLDPGYWSHILRRFSTLEEAARRYPDDPDIWLALGSTRYHYGLAVGATPAQTLNAFDRGIALDSRFAPAYNEPTQLALEMAGPAAAKRYLDGYLSSTRGIPRDAEMVFVGQLLRPGGAQSAEVQRFIDSAPAARLFGAAYTVGGWPDSAESAVRLLRVLAAGRRGSGFASDTVAMQQRLAWALTFRGHLREARTLIGERFGSPFTELALLGVVPVDTADALVARWFQSADRPSLRFGQGDRCHRSFGAAVWWASRGDTASLQRLVRRGDAEARSASSVYALFKARGDADLGRAALPLARRDTAEALRRFLAFPDSLCPFSPLAIHLVRFHMLAAVRRDRDAALVFDRSAGSKDPYPWHAAWVLGVLERGRVAERLKDGTTAIRSYQYVVDAWRHADPELGRYVEEARAGLARLAQEPRR